MFLIIKKKNLTYISIIFIILIFLNCAVLYALHNNKIKKDYYILIYIEDKRLYLLENNKCIKKYPIATGKSESPSPIGEWKITEKSDWGEGFGGFWMGLNVKWGKYGIHGTSREYTIGHAVSHGCIRMLNKDAKELYNIVSVGTPVKIIGGSYGPFGSGFRKLAPGDTGADVLAVQKRLKELGYFKGKTDGTYHDDLKRALYKFQADKGLRIKYTLTQNDYNAMGFFEFE